MLVILIIIDLYMEKNKKKYLALLLLPVLAVGIYFAVAQINQPEVEVIEQEDEELTPEEVIEALNGNLNEEEHDLKVTIISPEEETFYMSQARMYEALLEGNGKYREQVNCIWEYYINENNEEYLLDTREMRRPLSKESSEMCGFTSTLVNKRGKLRVKLTIEVIDGNTGEIVESVSDEKNYTVI
jgi:hypothetical protein